MSKARLVHLETRIRHAVLSESGGLIGIAVVLNSTSREGARETRVLALCDRCDRSVQPDGTTYVGDSPALHASAESAATALEVHSQRCARAAQPMAVA